MAATIHLIHGFIGFGKSKISKELAHELPAVVLNNDDFMAKLYGKNPPAEMFRDYYNRIDGLIWDLAENIVRAGTDVIIDYGFWTRQSRAEAYARAKKITENVVFHNVQCDMDTARQSVIERNRRHPDVLFIDAATFDLFRPQFEPISDDEHYPVINHDNNIKEWKYAAYILPVRKIGDRTQVAMAVYKTGWHGLIGGRLDGNETPYQAMCREVCEELGDDALCITKGAIAVPESHKIKVRDVLFRRAKNEEHTYFVSLVPEDTELVFCEKDNDGFEVKWIDLDLLGDKKTIVIDDMRQYFINTIIPFIKSQFN